MNLESEKTLESDQQNQTETGSVVGIESVPILDVTKVENLDSAIFKAFHETRRPVILRGYDVGPCIKKWTPEYLISKCPEAKKVKVHKSKEKRLDFRRKNFVYDTISFGELIQLCSGVKGGDKIQEEKWTYFWYLRSIGEDPR